MQKIRFWVLMITIGGLYIGLSFFGASLITVTPSQDQVSNLQTRVDILKSLTEAIAIVLAGVWTYELYIKNRYDHPYPKIQHRIEHHDLSNGAVYLSVFVSVTNEGKTKLDLVSGEIHLRRVKPLSMELRPLIDGNLATKYMREGAIPKLFNCNRHTIDWREIGYRKWEWENLEKRGNHVLILEPGQIREIHFDFLIQEGLELIQVLSFFNYENTYWELSTLYSLEDAHQLLAAKQTGISLPS